MIANLKTVLKYAEEHKCAIGAFNTPTLEALRAILDNAEELNVPIIISHAECHENEAPLDIIGPVMILMAKNANPERVFLPWSVPFPAVRNNRSTGN